MPRVASLAKDSGRDNPPPPPAVRVLPPAPNLLPNVTGEKEEKEEAPAPPHLQVNSLPEVLVAPEDPKQWG